MIFSMYWNNNITSSSINSGTTSSNRKICDSLNSTYLVTGIKINRIYKILGTTCNTFFLVTDTNNNIYHRTSTGIEFKKKKRMLASSTGIVASHFIKALLKEHTTTPSLVVEVQGIPNKIEQVLHATKNFVKIASLHNITKIPFNGTRKKRQKR